MTMGVLLVLPLPVAIAYCLLPIAIADCYYLLRLPIAIACCNCILLLPIATDCLLSIAY